jgi:thiosulfate/3-mercaptopyruvate sulfurtransferase
MKYAFAAGAMAILLAVPAAAWSQRPPLIGAQELRRWLDAAEPPAVIDVRGRQVYRSGTLPRAIDAGSDPLGYLPERNDMPLVLLAPVTLGPLLIEAWTARLTEAGHRVWLLAGGMAAWVDAGGRVEIPDSVYPRPGQLPFRIPKGLCEGGEPVQVFE